MIRTVTLSPRRGFSLAEVLVALALAAGPILLAVNLVQSNVAAARFNVEKRSTPRLVLMDLVELLLGETTERLKDVASGRGRLEQVLQDRIAQLPEGARKQYTDQVKPLMGKMSCAFEEDWGGVKGLARLTLSVAVDAVVEVRVFRLFRPDRRTLPPEGGGDATGG